MTYLETYVPANFFYEEALLRRLDDMSDAEKEYGSPLLQRNMEIVGKVVLSATHVKR